MTMTKEELIQYAIKRARPKFCEVILSRFVARIEKEATSIEDVEKIFSEMRNGKQRESRKLRIVP